VWGGDAACAHEWGTEGSAHRGGPQGASGDRITRDTSGADAVADRSTGVFCQRCGAWRGHLGLEPTPDLYVQHLVSVFREVWRVLKPYGTAWLNLGDSYANDDKWGGATGGKHVAALHGNTSIGRARQSTGLKSKDLIGIPWRVAFALQDAGWYLRSDIIWAKPNCLPESVTDRPTKSHEYVFLLTKSPDYFYDADAIKEPYDPESFERYKYAFGGAKNQELTATETSGPGTRTHPIGMRPYKGLATKDYDAAGAQNPSDTKRRILDGMENSFGRNRRTVWTINPAAYSGAHFATFPEKLVEPCLLAGTSAYGNCARCGSPWERQTRTASNTDPEERRVALERAAAEGQHFDRHRAASGLHAYAPTVTTLGWQPTCDCGSADVKPALVYDPFCGSGTVGEVAERLGRRWVGTDLAYQNLAKERTMQLGLRF
jgi:DNA modification methylase